MRFSDRTKTGIVVAMPRWTLLLLTLVLVMGCRKEDTDMESDRSVFDDAGAQTLVRKDLQMGNGATAKRGDMITAHYTLWDANGRKVESSYDTGRPIRKPLAQGALIDGWVVGIPGMRVGGKRRLEVPSNLAYGNGDLVFEVELLAVEPQ